MFFYFSKKIAEVRHIWQYFMSSPYPIAKSFIILAINHEIINPFMTFLTFSLHRTMFFLSFALICAIIIINLISSSFIFLIIRAEIIKISKLFFHLCVNVCNLQNRQAILLGAILSKRFRWFKGRFMSCLEGPIFVLWVFGILLLIRSHMWAFQ